MCVCGYVCVLCVVRARVSACVYDYIFVCVSLFWRGVYVLTIIGGEDTRCRRLLHLASNISERNFIGFSGP